MLGLAQSWLDANSSKNVFATLVAPPPQVKRVTLQLPSAQPFFEVPIED